jgi:exonuclease SbcD
MRILHTSDWHIGRNFHEKSLIDDQAHALEQLHAAIRDSRPDALIIAGDLYDRPIPPAQAVTLLNDTLRRVALDFGVPVFMISGNHDSAERVGFGAELLKKSNVHIVSNFAAIRTPLRLTDDWGDVDLFGVPYLDVDEVRLRIEAKGAESNQERIRWNSIAAARHCLREVHSARDPSTPAIVVAHSFVSGAKTSESELDLSIGGIDALSRDLFKEFAYTALGHLHRPQNVGPAVRYSGSLLPYHFEETDSPKSLSLIEMGKDRTKPRIEEFPISPRRKLTVIKGTFEEILEQGRELGRIEDYVLVRRINDGPVLDLAAKLRDHFPNLCSVELLAPEAVAGANPLAKSLAAQELRSKIRKNRDVPALFEGFFEELTQLKLTDSERKTLKDLWQNQEHALEVQS